MGEPRPEKVAVVTEVREKFADSGAAVLTDYRGLDVAAMAELRRALNNVGGDYKIYKNTLVRLAVREIGLEIEDLLVGPTAIAFVGPKADGSPGDAAAVAKALKDFARTNESLVVKGGVLDDKILSVDELRDLADLPPREVLLAQLAGAFQAPMAKLAALLQALPQNFAYGLQALIDSQGGVPPAAADEVEESGPEAAAEAAAVEADAPDTEDTAEAPAVEADAPDTENTEQAPAAEAEATESASADAEPDQEN